MKQNKFDGIDLTLCLFTGMVETKLNSSGWSSLMLVSQMNPCISPRGSLNKALLCDSIQLYCAAQLVAPQLHFFACFGFPVIVHACR